MSLVSSRLLMAGSMLVGASLFGMLGTGVVRADSTGSASATLYNNATDANAGSVAATSSGNTLQIAITLQGEQATASYAVSICEPDPATGDADDCVTPSAGASFTTDATGAGSDTVSLDNATNVVVVTVTNTADPADSASAVVVNPAPIAPGPFQNF